LFGSFSPTIREDDVVAVSQVLLRSYTATKSKSVVALEKLSSDLEIDEGSPPWTQGYLTAEDILDRTGQRGTVPLDIEGVLTKLGIKCDEIELTDTSIRAISIVGEHHSPTVFVNTSYKYGNHEWVRRFSLAHEFGHLLIDRDRASRFAVASGAWAPRAIERRANAFAVGLLMPENEILELVTGKVHAKNAWKVINELAQRFEVSRMATIDRLFNLGLMDPELREQMRTKALAQAALRKEDVPIAEDQFELG
jgi:Zn-dependent peptidase ImmA (M78 family)